MRGHWSPAPHQSRSSATSSPPSHDGRRNSPNHAGRWTRGRFRKAISELARTWRTLRIGFWLPDPLSHARRAGPASGPTICDIPAHAGEDQVAVRANGLAVAVRAQDGPVTGWCAVTVGVTAAGTRLLERNDLTVSATLIGCCRCAEPGHPDRAARDRHDGPQGAEQRCTGTRPRPPVPATTPRPVTRVITGRGSPRRVRPLGSNPATAATRRPRARNVRSSRSLPRPVDRAR